ncbi:MAG: Asp-tRNA(Asn)/Glu-tRNA(Gln) amidotransferase subunit GatB [Bacteroidetes bacterium]|nr:Asp-tRNA(Asn)/Glu-tRNA(Gln) amidotransferase subunit GatB [Bacteroidota bacterium]MDA1120239.1 Asp-tRNA(Asn)/Glu-tRNA(Gln) amidotransferase subunit GatB [Bacteroidota bacterium]
MLKYKPTIGLEVHIQLSTRSKVFCADKNEYGSAANTNISEISLAHPGTLPVLNKTAIEHAIKMGFVCKSSISQEMFFDRKNYFYPDLPKGYQLTQDKTPICVGGEIQIRDGMGKFKTIKLTKIHLEEDAGKLIHEQTSSFSMVDFNRAGVPLIELVTEPVIENDEDAVSLLIELRKIVRYLGISDGDMEKGSLRCDANVSIAPLGLKELGKKVEVKNMNSFRHVQKAIQYEIKRQGSILEKGNEVISETRLYDVDSGETYDMRTKEELNDYRYFPEPDLCPFYISQEWLDQIRKQIPILPSQYIEKFIHQYAIAENDALTLTESRELAQFFDQVCEKSGNYKAAVNWLIGPCKSYLNEMNCEINETNLTVDRLTALIEIVDQNRVSFSVASSEILPHLFSDKTANPLDLGIKLNLLIDESIDQIENFVEELIKKYPEKVAAYKNGKKGLLGMFMGELMKETGGKIDPKKASETIKAALES